MGLICQALHYLPKHPEVGCHRCQSHGRVERPKQRVVERRRLLLKAAQRSMAVSGTPGAAECRLMVALIARKAPQRQSSCGVQGLHSAAACLAYGRDPCE